MGEKAGEVVAPTGVGGATGEGAGEAAVVADGSENGEGEEEEATSFGVGSAMLLEDESRQR